MWNRMLSVGVSKLREKGKMCSHILKRDAGSTCSIYYDLGKLVLKFCITATVWILWGTDIEL